MTSTVPGTMAMPTDAGTRLATVPREEWLATILAKLDTADIIVKSLYEFYVVEKNIYTILPIITGNSKISIRVLDWFVTNYAKKYNVVYPLEVVVLNSITFFNVFLQYKSQLKGYKKKLFDPFCRKKRIYLYYEPNECCVTTIGQLNFFRWAIKNKVLQYVEQNLDSIVRDMNCTSKVSTSSDSHSDTTVSSNSDNVDTESPTTSSEGSDASNSEERRTRHELSKGCTKFMTHHRMNVVIDLN